MIVLILERVRPTLRGEVSRWLLEVKPGIFTGRVSALVRDEVWQLIAENIGKGAALMIYPTNTEQGFSVRMLGNPSRKFEDIDGLLLIKR
jgi:CRISPR-associated protein Cas2